jgi:hypothetical protein
MIPPRDANIIEWDTSRFWFDENGILCSVSKKGARQTLEQTREAMEKFKKLIGDKKVCLLVDVTNSSESSKEVRDYAAREFPKVIKAIAMISNSALGKMLANLFFTVRSQPYPVRMFNDEGEAKEWLKKYL